MPNKISLTQEEKNAIILRHRELVDEFNKYLPDDNKIPYDNDLENKLEDEAEVKYYKTLQAIGDRERKQKEIYQKLIEDYGDMPQERLSLARTFQSALKTENTEQAKEYNENLYREYQSDPDKVFYKRYKEVLEFNPQKLLNALDDKQKLADFYLENQTVCDDAFVYDSAISNKYFDINKDLQKSASGMSKTIESLNIAKKVCDADMVDYFSFPKMTSEQYNMVMAGNPSKYMTKGAPLQPKFNQFVAPAKPEEVKAEFQAIKNHGLMLGKGFFLRYKALEHDDKTNTTKEIPIEDAVKNYKSNGNITIEERSRNEIFNLRRINDTYDREYMNIWQEKFAKNYNDKPFDFDEIKEANKGGTFERLFNRTSKEYQAFIRTLGEYNNPESPNYMNKKLLKETAQAYFDHKTERGISFNRIDKTGQDRLMLVSAVIQTINDMDNNEKEVSAKINNAIYEIDPARKQFLRENDLDDNLLNNEITNDFESLKLDKALEA